MQHTQPGLVQEIWSIRYFITNGSSLWKYSTLHTSPRKIIYMFEGEHRHNLLICIYCKYHYRRTASQFTDLFSISLLHTRSISLTILGFIQTCIYVRSVGNVSCILHLPHQMYTSWLMNTIKKNYASLFASIHASRLL